MNAITNSPLYDAAAVARVFDVRFDESAPPAAENFMTFFDPGWSILRLREVVGDKRIFYPQDSYEDEPFARLEELPRYRQLRNRPRKGSYGKAFFEQRSMLPPDEEVALARVVIMGLVVHFLVMGERLLPSYWARCADQTSTGLRVLVGNFDSAGVRIDSFWDGRRDVFLGLASSRKVEPCL